MGEWDDPYNVLGFAGGVVLAASLLPQIYLAHKRQSTADISYMWQAVYIVGLLTLMIYYAHFKLWPVFYPMTFEMFCILYLTGLKVLHEVIQKKPKMAKPALTDGPNAPFDMSASRGGGAHFRIPSKRSLDEAMDASRRSLGFGSRASLGDSSRSLRMGSRASLRDGSRSGNNPSTGDHDDDNEAVDGGNSAGRGQNARTTITSTPEKRHASVVDRKPPRSTATSDDSTSDVDSDANADLSLAEEGRGDGGAPSPPEGCAGLAPRRKQ